MSDNIPWFILIIFALTIHSLINLLSLRIQTKRIIDEIRKTKPQ